MDYFIPRGNRVYRLLVGVRPAYRYALTLFMCSGFTYGWFTMVYHRLESTIARYATDVENSKKQYELAQQSQFESENLKKIVNDLRATVQALRTNHTCDLPMPFMIDMVKDSGLNLHSCMTTSEVEKEWYAKTKLNLTVQGAMASMLSFFSKVQESDRMIHCNEVRLARAGKDFFTMNCEVSFLQMK